MKTPRWFIWFTLGYAVYNLLTITLHQVFPALTDYTNNAVVFLTLVLACVMLGISMFYLIMFICFIYKKCDKHGLWLSGLLLFDVLFTVVVGLIFQILLAGNTQLGFIAGNIIGAIIPAVLLIYSTVLLMRK